MPTRAGQPFPSESPTLGSTPGMAPSALPPDPPAGEMAAEPGDQPLLLSSEQLAVFNRRRNDEGWAQLIGHLTLLGLGAALWITPTALIPAASPPLLLVVKLVGVLLLGWALAFGFCAMHECGHRTAFASRSINDTVAWWMGVLSFYNADFYRRYHQWHHRFTHQIGLDPELEDAPPSTLPAYLLELSGLPWWLGKIQGHWRALRGDFAGAPYIPPEATAAVARSVRLQFAVYAAVLLVSIPLGRPLLLFDWLLPLAVGQPLLRFVLLAEHGGCSTSADGLRNTRTTLTLAPLRWLMWNMPFHTEHHLYPSLPFHALPQAHDQLAPQLVHCSPGYLAVHRGFLGNLAALAL
ncbi:fatty acid desaturase [Synechococcus sp. CBW1006]|uniref:fatty acid desaturase n=1 Tax=unclassified Synechococcus TaxID=2626047 RepID=UPI00351C270D